MKAYVYRDEVLAYGLETKKNIGNFRVTLENHLYEEYRAADQEYWRIQGELEKLYTKARGKK